VSFYPDPSRSEEERKGRRKRKSSILKHPREKEEENGSVKSISHKKKKERGREKKGKGGRTGFDPAPAEKEKKKRERGDLAFSFHADKREEKEGRCRGIRGGKGEGGCALYSAPTYTAVEKRKKEESPAVLNNRSLLPRERTKGRKKREKEKMYLCFRRAEGEKRERGDKECSRYHDAK